jgi:hypothetical protein
MLKKITLALVGFLILGYLSVVQAQDDVKVVPIGETIKPEAGTGVPAKKKVARPAVVKEGTSFLVELGTALSSGLTQSGDTISIYAAEDVSSRGKAAIAAGARGMGRVTAVDKKARTLSVTFEEIDGTSGAPVGIGGSIQLTGEKNQAAAAVGERFTATVDEKITVKPKPKKKTKEAPEPPLTAFAEIEGKGAKVDIKKGQASGKVKLILEAPKGFSSDDIQIDTVALTQVNSHQLEEGVRPTAQDPKQGDGNKNGTSDWTMYFGAWDFIRNQPKGSNTLYISGNLKNGRPFQATTRVSIAY